jgi:hypothetical protein
MVMSIILLAINNIRCYHKCHTASTNSVFSSNCRVDSICFEMLVLVVREIVVDLCLDTHKFSLVM